VKAGGLYPTLLSRGPLASPRPGAETRTSCPCRNAREAAATAASKAASLVLYAFSAFPSWRTRHSASLPMILKAASQSHHFAPCQKRNKLHSDRFRPDHDGVERFNGRALDSWFCCVEFRTCAKKTTSTASGTSSNR
jgi:hypothetical protein